MTKRIIFGIRKILTLLFVFSLLQGHCNKIWSLDDCINFAIENNLQLKNVRVISKINKENFRQSKRELLPSLRAGSGYSYRIGKSVDPNTNAIINTSFFSNSYNLSSSITIFNGFSRLNTIFFNKLNYAEGMKAEESASNDIAFSVMNAYYDALYYKGLTDIISEQKELSEFNLKRIKKLVTVGRNAKADILEFEAEMAVEELNLIQTQNLYKTAILTLKQLMNFPAEKELEIGNEKAISQSIMPEAINNSEELYKTALEHLPQIRISELQKEKARKNLSIYRGNLYPSLYLGGSFSTGFYETNKDSTGITLPFRDQLSNNQAQNYFLSLSIPIFERWRSRSDIKIAKLRLQEAKTNFNIEKNLLYSQVEQASQELNFYIAEYKQNMILYNASKSAFELAGKKLEKGMISINEFYVAKNRVAKANGELLRTKLQLIIKQKTINFFKGLPVFIFTNNSDHLQFTFENA